MDATDRALLQQAIRHSFNDGGLSSTSSSKRFGVVFPPGVDLSPTQDPAATHSEQGPDDATMAISFSTGEFSASSWEFLSPQPSHRSRRHSAVSHGARKSTPAQELASRYRAGMPLHTVLATSNATYARSGYGKDTVRSGCQVHYDGDPKPHFRLSRMQALQDTLPEARRYMQDQGVSESEPILCGRPDCTDQLRDLQALMRHLHIHNLDDNSKPRLQCGRCEDRLNEHDSEECMKHICRPRRLRGRGRLNSLPDCTSGITSPIKETFSKLIHNIRA